MPVGQLCSVLSYEEYLGWRAFFGRYPVGWREDYRAGVLASITAQTGMNRSKVDMTKLFPSLAMMEEGRKERANAMDSLKRSFLGHLIRQSEGGASFV